MKALLLYIAAGCIAVNVAGNIAASTAEGLQQRQSARIQAVCQVNNVPECNL